MTFSREITLGNVLTVGSIVFAFGVAYSKIGTLEEAVADQKTVDVRQDEDARRLRQEIREDLREINRKLDSMKGVK